MKTLILITAVLFSFNLMAFDDANNPNVAYGQIESIDVGEQGDAIRIFMKDVANVKNPSACTNKNLYVIEMNENKEMMFKLLMTAAVAKRQVRFYVHGCSNSTLWGGGKTYPTISFARMY